MNIYGESAPNPLARRMRRRPMLGPAAGYRRAPAMGAPQVAQPVEPVRGGSERFTGVATEADYAAKRQAAQGSFSDPRGAGNPIAPIPGSVTPAGRAAPGAPYPGPMPMMRQPLRRKPQMPAALYRRSFPG